MCSNQIPAACVNSVIGAYLLNGDVDSVNTALSNYTNMLSQLENSDAFDKELEQLELLYTSMKSYLDYCQNPTGSFNQSSDTLSGYRDTIRDCISSLDALFSK